MQPRTHHTKQKRKFEIVSLPKNDRYRLVRRRQPPFFDSPATESISLLLSRSTQDEDGVSGSLFLNNSRPRNDFNRVVPVLSVTQKTQFLGSIAFVAQTTVYREGLRRMVDCPVTRHPRAAHSQRMIASQRKQDFLSCAEECEA